jgi:hypothetical protein
MGQRFSKKDLEREDFLKVIFGMIKRNVVFGKSF